ncbi:MULTISPECIES: hypothetical protein [unclassified Cellulophaga]|uniref:hypothetical protein n=1 Tax=unclassified Cellulophaga TaxID=2634405 RepID=UPI0026E192D7|nr:MULTISPECIES: hypothetical protein [unclassified Cellulophaga]MDO6489876.1 hypothetical protein [Cellulophaga sp. 2_MG-2023]MDO6494930.1 hypothetical protein [Cellulophaga sp. 3_MG-2023]
MKKIHFGNLNKKGRWILLPLILIGLFLIINGAFDFIEFTNPKTNKYLNAIGYLIVFGFSTQMFWYQNYVQWNKRGILIRIKSFFGKNIKFKEIKSSQLVDKKLIITETYGNKIEIDLTHIVESDVTKLYEIVKENTIANTVYN